MAALRSAPFFPCECGVMITAAAFRRPFLHKLTAEGRKMEFLIGKGRRFFF